MFFADGGFSLVPENKNSVILAVKKKRKKKEKKRKPAQKRHCNAKKKR